MYYMYLLRVSERSSIYLFTIKAISISRENKITLRNEEYFFSLQEE